MCSCIAEESKGQWSPTEEDFDKLIGKNLENFIPKIVQVFNFYLLVQLSRNALRLDGVRRRKRLL